MFREFMDLLIKVIIPLYILIFLGLGCALHSYGTNGVFDITAKELIAHTVVAQLEFTHFMIIPKKVRGKTYRDFVSVDNASEFDFDCLKNKWIKRSYFFKTLDFIIDFKKDENGVLITDYVDNVKGNYPVRPEDCVYYDHDGKEPLAKKTPAQNLRIVDNRKKEIKK
jgi:hypothetical protein